MLKSTSGTRTTPPPHTRDAAPIKSKVAPRLTASQGIDYHSMVSTVSTSLHRERASPPHGLPHGHLYPIHHNHCTQVLLHIELKICSSLVQINDDIDRKKSTY